MKKVYINDTNCITPLGFDLERNWQAVQASETGIARIAQLGNLTDFYASRIDDNALDQAFKKQSKTEVETSRLEKLLFLALDPIVQKHGIQDKTGLIVSTTKGNIDFLATTTPQQADLNILAKKVANHYGFSTEPILVCNACVSGVLAISVAKRMIQMDQFDEVYVVAGDILSEFVVSGFNSFQAMGNAACKPYDQDRSGVNLGEASAAIYVSASKEAQSVEIIGEASIGDANHISGPSRTGEGLYQSVCRALAEAGIESDAIDMISAHGTATVFNDEMEAIAFHRLGMQHIPLHSLKGYYGHTLGASGLLEVVMAMMAMSQDSLIVSKGFEVQGTSEKLNVTTKNQNQKINRILKTASGFGGTNAAIILEKVN